MLSLERLQKTVARSVLGMPHFGLSPLLSSRHAPTRTGALRIYQNNTRASLTATLMAVFPGDRAAGRRALLPLRGERVHPPPSAEEPRLVRYGAEFPAFLRTFEGLEEMPFVAETARLEWAIAEALDARVAAAGADLGARRRRCRRPRRSSSCSRRCAL